jgi:hypothetical protein
MGTAQEVLVVIKKMYASNQAYMKTGNISAGFKTT